MFLVFICWSFSLPLSLSVAAEGQQAKTIPRIGYVSGTGSTSNPGPYVEALRQGLRDLGYVDGKNIVVEYRGAEARLDRVPALISELVQQKIDVLVAPFADAVRNAKQLNVTIPVVIVSSDDPIASGVAGSLARPSGNFTGIYTLTEGLSGKRLELLTEVIPGKSRVAVLRDADSKHAKIIFNEYEAAARLIGLQLQSLDVRGLAPDLDSAFQLAVKGRANAILTITNANLFAQQKRIADLAVRNRLPSMFQGSAWVESGGLMSYSTDDIAVFRHTATYVAKILKGTKPGDLPIEQPTKFELVINLKTAKQIGLTIPPNVLARADRVIR